MKNTTQPMVDAWICDAVRTPIGRYGGCLSSVRADDLAAVPIAALIERHVDVDWGAVDDIYYGCANQSGEDNRNVARMAGLLAGLPVEVPAVTLNRLCGSGLEAVVQAARAIQTGQAELALAGGVESMSRAPFVMPKPDKAFSRDARVYDTTLGWRFVNVNIEAQYGVESMPETAENLAHKFDISRRDQDQFALRSQERALQAQQRGWLAEEIVPVAVPQRKAEPMIVAADEQPRETSLQRLSQLPTPFREPGTVTAGNASSLNDGACALLLASREAAERYGLRPLARVAAAATAGVQPSLMGIGPVPATQRLLTSLEMTLAEIDLIELNEAFAAQSLAVIRQWGLGDDDARINPQGGAIALGHPLGMSGARLATSAVRQLARSGGRWALCTMCIGVGQGIAVLLERFDANRD